MTKVGKNIWKLFILFYVIIVEKIVLSGVFGDDEEEENAEDAANLYKESVPQRKNEEDGDGSGKSKKKNKEIPNDEKSKEEQLKEEEEIKSKKKEKEEKENKEESGKVVDVEGEKYNYEKVLEKAKEYFDDIDFANLSEEKIEKYVKQFVNTDEFEDIKDELKSDVKKDNKKENKGENNDEKFKNPIKIAGQVYSYEEIYEKAVEYFEDIDFEKLTEEKKARYVKDYINSAHFKEGEKSLSKKHQTASDLTKEAQKLRDEAEEKLKDAQSKLTESQVYLDGIKKKREDLNKILEINLEEIVDDDEREEKKLDKRDAKKELDKLEELEKKEKKNYDSIIIQSWIDELQSLPGLQTSRHPYDIIQASKTTAGRKAIKDKTEIKISEGIKRVLNDYNDFLSENPDAEIGILEYFEDRNYKYPELSALTEIAKDNESSDLPDLSELKSSEMIKRLIENQKSYKALPKSTTKTSIAKKNGGEGDEPEVNKDDFGYSTGNK